MFKHIATLLHYPKTGKGQQISIFPWISTDFTNFTSPELLQTPGQLSTVWYDDFGNSFALRRVGNGGWVQGDNLTWITAGAGPNFAFQPDTVAALSTVRVVNLTGGGLTVNAEAAGPANMFGSWLFNDTALANVNDKLKLVKSNTASTITVSNVDTRVSNMQNDADAYSVAPVAAQVLSLIRPYVALKFPTASATTALSTGIAVQAGTAGNYGFAQVDGLAMVSCKGDVVPSVAGEPVVPDGVTAGFVKGAAAVAANQVGTACAPHAAATGMIPVWLSIWAGI